MLTRCWTFISLAWSCTLHLEPCVACLKPCPSKLLLLLPHLSRRHTYNQLLTPPLPLLSSQLLNRCASRHPTLHYAPPPKPPHLAAATPCKSRPRLHLYTTRPCLLGPLSASPIAGDPVLSSIPRQSSLATHTLRVQAPTLAPVLSNSPLDLQHRNASTPTQLHPSLNSRRRQQENTTTIKLDIFLRTHDLVDLACVPFHPRFCDCFRWSRHWT